ncbi:MAG TPA: SDR family oxidoreductase [Solirubrobacteraceae bacterium]|nr:SDR family oxidoreductase [Solirubrobacteraceae bacterium]
MAEVALVTGASSGIGAEFAKQLSARGYELILVARRAERMQQLASELPGRAHVVSCDLANDSAGLAAKVGQLGLEVDMLVNNAGFGTHGRFVDIDHVRDAELVRVNCEALVTLTHAFLPGMLSRRRGGVITVASTAGMQPIPFEMSYSASKAFARSFSEALSAELRGTGVKALCVSPGPVPTEWQEVAGYEPGYLPPVPGKISAEQVARESLEAFDQGKRSIIPGAVIRWYMRINSPAPVGVKLRVLERMYRPD